jgi:hypothetical protein
MIRIVICSGLLISFSLQATRPTHAAESKQDTAACEIVVEIAAAAAGYGFAVANRVKEFGKMVATGLGDKIGSKFIAHWICGTSDENGGGASTAPASPRVILPDDDHIALSARPLGLKPDSALGRDCLSLGLTSVRCFGAASPDLQRTRDDIRNGVFKYLSIRPDPNIRQCALDISKCLPVTSTPAPSPEASPSLSALATTVPPELIDDILNLQESLGVVPPSSPSYQAPSTPALELKPDLERSLGSRLN